jgi:hypothetical protein
MRWFGWLVLIALGAGGAVAAERLLVMPAISDTGGSVPETEPGPGDPPVVWVDGTLDEASDNALVVREGQGPRIDVERFAGGATTFYTRNDKSWTEVGEPAAEDLPVGEEVCVEALLDEGRFLALRVFLGADCGPG